MSTGSPRQLWLLPVLLITVIATAIGGLLARDLYKEPPAAPPPTVVATEPAPGPQEEQPGPPTVKGTADAVAHPLYGQLQRLLQTYFDAVNAKDYAQWASVVTGERQANQPEQKWLDEYRSTTDGSIVMHRIEARGDGAARVLLTFTSTQDEEDAPRELPRPCIHWNVVWAFAVEDGEWKLAAGPSAATPQHEACG
ncbi:hypothetical protein [Actinophytocola glycyrrhizae]|uniref:Mce-associated membrane protein n=1 Tax=Actinophytocola glycyrrhizae TaxID=2044873 RepID=A0ABV9SBX5_9PSEU